MRPLLAAALAARAAAFHGGSPPPRREVAAAEAPWWDDHGTDEPKTPWWEPAAEKAHATPWADHDYDEHESYASGPWAVVALAALLGQRREKAIHWRPGSYHGRLRPLDDEQ